MTGPLPPSVPPAPPSAPVPSPAPVPIADVLLASLPDKLQNLQRPVLLPGSVGGQTADGLLQLRTQAGEVLIRTPVTLQLNQSILLQIPAGNPPTQATAFAPQGLAQPATPQAGAQAGAQAGGSSNPAPAVSVNLPTPAPTANAALALRPGMVLPAITLSAAPGLTLAAPAGSLPIGQQQVLPSAASSVLPNSFAAEPAPQAPHQLWGSPGGALEAGARFGQFQGLATPPQSGTAPPLTGGIPQGQPIPTPSAGTPAEAPSPAPAAPTAAQATQSPPTPTPVMPGSTVALKVLDARSADGTQPPPATPQEDGDGAPVLSGTVTRANAHGQPILATPRGTFLLATPLPVPPGTQMTVALTDPAQVLAAGLPHASNGESEAAKGWPAFHRALSTLATLEPAMAQALVNTIMPQPNRKLGAALMFFLSAARGGDAKGWLGDEATQALEKAGRRDVLRPLFEEFQAQAREAAATPAGEWKPYLIPFMDGNTIARLTLHVRPVADEESGKDGRERGKPGSRFLLDVDLSRFGPIQLDGLVRPRRFDLILRSRMDLPPEVRRDLPGIFTNCLEAVGYTGALSFQSGGRNWMSVPPRSVPGRVPPGTGVSA